MSRGADVGVLLERALLQMAAAVKIDLTIADASWSRWASATFTGARHDLSVTTGPSPTLDAWLGALPEAEFTVRGHLVADLAITSRARVGDTITLRIAVLTVEAD
ncbi:hypothetical protein ABS767_10140 [Sphingomonas sp. ST-64]|uniref:Uncharacterized protein n=1 Tax=Sphingomonas plantiphila TaxID=3163295 RepID=A0ABW8YMT0_9SPHN